jgi:uncharacterized protein DUF3617
MKKLIALGVAFLLPTALVAGGKIKLNVKTGLWQTTTSRTVNGSMGLPPEMAAKMTPAQRARFEAAAKKQASGTPRTESHKDCLTQEKLAEDPFTDKSHGDNAKCEETVIKSTATDLEVRELCTYGSSKTDIHLSFHADSPEHVTGSGTTTATTGGRVMKSVMKMDSKWISAACPAGKK